MDLIYPINFVGYDEWVRSGFSPALAGGDVITRDGEVLGIWRVVDYDPDACDDGARYEFLANNEEAAKFFEDFAPLDSGMRRGFALSNLSRTIKEWQEAQPC